MLKFGGFRALSETLLLDLLCISRNLVLSHEFIVIKSKLKRLAVYVHTRNLSGHHVVSMHCLGTS